MTELIYATRFFTPGTRIFGEGEDGLSAYLVEEGLVELDRFMEGRRVPFLKVGPGGIFGEMAVIDGGPRTATATAIENTKLVVVSERVFRAKLNTADPFLRALVRLFVANLRASTPDGALLRGPSEAAPPSA